MLQRTGCHYLVYAPESGSPRTLERIKKRVTLDGLMKSVREAKRQNMVLRINLIIGFPGETRMDVFKTAWFGLKTILFGVDETSVNIFSPYPGSELFQELVDDGRLVVNDDYFLALTSLNSDFGALNPLTFNESMGPRELAIYRLTLLLSFYAIGYLLYPSRILRTWRSWQGEKKIAATVFEHRIGDYLRRRFGKDKPKRPSEAS